MAIDPRLYEKYSGRSGDPYKRLGEALARSSKIKSERDAMPKGFSGGVRRGMWAPWWYNMFSFLAFWAKDKSRDNGERPDKKRPRG